MTTDLILGTAGHIDHGKTSLIRALTGVDCDRLPEEKRRGITIDIGFAELQLEEVRLGIVDVPGHERFVRNMLAGATGMNVALLIIAADESVRQQTREHFEILKMLELSAGVIALTKCDLVAPDWLDLVETEVRELVADSFLAHAPLIRTSAQTGLGLDELRAALLAAARHVARNGIDVSGPFRMAIDRTFTIAGHGTVVTGSVHRGLCRVGDELVIEPGNISVRVRGLRNHDRVVESVQRGQRAAINLVGVHHEALHRGHELATPGHLRPSRVVTVDLSLLPSAPRPLKSRTRIRLHMGTAELMATVVLLDRETLKPGDTALAQLFLEDFAVASWNQPFVARSESPLRTIGGGRVLDPNAERFRRATPETLHDAEQLRAPDEVTRASAALSLLGIRTWMPSDLVRLAGVAQPDQVIEELKRRGELVEVAVSPTRRLRIHRRTVERLGERVAAVLARLHEENPLKLSIERARVASCFEYLGETALFDYVLERMRVGGKVRLSDRGVALAGAGPKLSNNEQKLLNELVAQLRAAGIEPPAVQQLKQSAARFGNSIPQLLALAAADGQLVAISSEYYLHAECERQMREQLLVPLQGPDGLTVSQIREILKTSRKYAVPICEYLDRIGFTRRQGDVRRLAETATSSACTN